MATTRKSPAKRAATCVHQWALAPPPCTNTSPRVPGRPQANEWIGTPSTSTVSSVNGTARASRNQSGAEGRIGMSITVHPARPPEPAADPGPEGRDLPQDQRAASQSA